MTRCIEQSDPSVARGRWWRLRSLRITRDLGVVLSLGLANLCGQGGSLAHAASPASSASAPTSSESTLPPLPTVPRLEPTPPEQIDIDELQARLLRLQAENAEDRREAVREILEVRSRFVAAILLRLGSLADRADRDRMKRALAQVREKPVRPSDSVESTSRAPSDAHPDLLVQLIERARPKDDGWRDLVELVALSRMLTQIANLHAARGLIEIYVRFGEFMRVDVQNRLGDLKDNAVAALIEARRHRAEKVARWANRQLDRLGKGVPSEAIRTGNFEVLADVLRAYGRTKDPDAARIIVSYANSERFQIREAARQAIAMLGEVGLWQLRDAYENVVGKRPRRDWPWDRTARELFFEYDRLHVAKAYELLEVGKKAASEKRFEDMAKAYDALLTRTPQFDQAYSLAPGYFTLAEKLARSQPDAARTALVRVERLAMDSSLRQRARSLRDTICAEQRLRSGIVDMYLLRSAIERDPNNRRAKDLLSSGDRAAVEAQTLRTRWLTSGAIASVAIAAILLVLLRRRGQPTAIALEDSPHRAAPDNPGPPLHAERAADALAAPSPAGTAQPDTHCAISGAPDPSSGKPVVPADSPGTPRVSDAPDEAAPKRRDPFEDL